MSLGYKALHSQNGALAPPAMRPRQKAALILRRPFARQDWTKLGKISPLRSGLFREDRVQHRSTDQKRRDMTARRQKRTEKFQLLLSDEELVILDDWRFEHRMPSRAAALRELLRQGLLATGSEDIDGSGTVSGDYSVIGRK